MIDKMIESAAMCAGSLHKIAKLAVWRGRWQLVDEAEEDVNPLTRNEEKRQEWALHWQCGSKLQEMRNTP